jgi:hypothetical protein
MAFFDQNNIINTKVRQFFLRFYLLNKHKIV